MTTIGLASPPSPLTLTLAPSGRYYVAGPGIVTYLVDAEQAALLEPPTTQEPRP